MTLLLPAYNKLIGGASFFLEYRSKSDATVASDLMTIPADVQPGDLLIGVRTNDVWYLNNGTPVDAITGFTELASYDSNLSADVWVGYKIAAPGDAGSTISEDFYSGTVYKEMGVILAFSTGTGAGAVTANDTKISLSNVNPVTTQPSTLGATLPVIVLGVLTSNLSTPPTFDVETPAFDGEVVADSGGQGTIRVGYSIYNEGDTLADHSVLNDSTLYPRTILTYLEVSGG